MGVPAQRGYYSLFLPTWWREDAFLKAWALETALKHEAKRIIYVIPYTSIITRQQGSSVRSSGRRMYWSITQISPSQGMNSPKRQSATSAPAY